MPPEELTSNLLARRRVAPPTSVAIMRSSQVDAGRLDEELSLVLREQLVRALSLFQQASALSAGAAPL